MPTSGQWVAKYLATSPILRVIAIVLVVATIYGPELAHHYIPQPKLSSAILAELTSEPPAETLDAVGVRGASLPLITAPYNPQAVAQELLAGTFKVPQLQSEPILLLNYPHHLKQGAPTLRLIMASFELERLLLEAYEQTADTVLLELVLRRIQRLDRHESARWLPDEFLWNDHALAARAGVLTLAWKHARARKGPADDDIKFALVRQAARTGMLLANSGHFTARTNHGVMQNLALLQLATAFPAFPESGAWAQIAKNRLDLQLAHYVSEEGMVLEHSATYQHVGAELLARFIDILALRGELPSPALARKAESAREVLEQLLRPDGSLPILGNTPMTTGFNPVVTGSPLVQPREDDVEPQRSVTLMPLSGYVIWHAGLPSKRSQTVIAWGSTMDMDINMRMN